MPPRGLTILFLLIPHLLLGVFSDFNTDCAPFICGIFQDVGFPFYKNGGNPECGLPGFELLCGEANGPRILLGNRSFLVKELALAERKILVEDTQLAQALDSNSCELPDDLGSSGLGHLRPSPSNTYLQFFACYPNCIYLLFTDCAARYLAFSFSDEGIAAVDDANRVDVGGASCLTVRKFPVLAAINVSEEGRGGLGKAVRDGFYLSWPWFEECEDCRKTEGRCGSDQSGGVGCFHGVTSKKNRLTEATKIASGCCIAVFLIAAIATAGWWISKRKTKLSVTVEGSLQSYKSLTPRRYRCTDIKRMTSWFSNEIGRGASGRVFKGILSNGAIVAVKLLYESAMLTDSFINEVTTVGRIHHVNVVTLLGFCSEGRKRALIYEFMPNGSLDKFIFSNNDDSFHCLEWEKILEISLGIAKGIQYLHRGCNIKILHFDIKPHNILLDANFVPKISDFGLAKSCSKSASTVTTTAVKGTPGYIAPELFSRSFGAVSVKSDVYSYGILILEMVGRRKNGGEGSPSLEYLPGWVYQQLMEGKQKGEEGEIRGREGEMVEKMSLVGLWCVQINPVHRPSMDVVVQMLEGSLQNLEMPPKPFLSPNELVVCPVRQRIEDEAGPSASGSSL